MRDESILDRVDDYQYVESVFVRGKLHNYVVDLERYFRESCGDMMKHLYSIDKDLRAIVEHDRIHKERGYPFFFDSGLGHGLKCACPILITQDNVQEGIDWYESKKESCKEFLKSQKINHGTLREILDDPSKISSLDLTNYFYSNSIIRIQHAIHEEPAIRMRVFSNPLARNGRLFGESFCTHANQIEGVQAGLVYEESVKPDLKTLRAFLESGEIRRSRLRVKPLTFEIKPQRKGIEYTIHLGAGELEMLNHHLEQGKDKREYSSFNEGRRLCGDSPSWSPEQGWKILRNLYGILSIFDAGRDWRRSYYEFAVPPENCRAVETVKTNGGNFIKTVKKDSLPALASLFSRTLKLKTKYGWDFYPRFTTAEISNKSGLSKEIVKKSLVDLTGVLCRVDMVYEFSKKWNSEEDYTVHCWVPKWFLPKTGLTLAYQMLKSEGLTGAHTRQLLAQIPKT